MPQDQFIKVGSVNTRYWQAGTTGSAVVLLHGISCSVLEWQHNIEALAERHRVFALDLVGSGLSDKPADESYTIESLTRFVLAFMSALGIQKAHIAGNSLGGRIALECAVTAPDRTASIVLVDPAGVDGPETLLEFRLATLPLLGELLTRPNRHGIRMLWNKAFADPSGFVTDELVRTKVELARLPGAQAAFLKTLRSFVGLRGFREDAVARLHASLTAVRTPTLIVWGRDDHFVPVAHAETLRRLMPHAEVEIWDHCGHVPQIENAQRFNAAAIAFWGRIDRDRQSPR